MSNRPHPLMCSHPSEDVVPLAITDYQPFYCVNCKGIGEIFDGKFLLDSSRYTTHDQAFKKAYEEAYPDQSIGRSDRKKVSLNLPDGPAKWVPNQWTALKEKYPFLGETYDAVFTDIKSPIDIAIEGLQKALDEGANLPPASLMNGGPLELDVPEMKREFLADYGDEKPERHKCHCTHNVNAFGCKCGGW